MLDERDHDDPVVGGHQRQEVGPADGRPAVGMDRICKEDPGREHADVRQYHVPEMVVLEDG